MLHRLYAQAFPTALADTTHAPFLSLETPENWITPTGFALYLNWKAVEHDGCDMNAQNIVAEASMRELVAYREFVSDTYCLLEICSVTQCTPLFKMLTAELTHDPFFQLDNAEVWIQHVAFQAYTLQFTETTLAGSSASVHVSSRSRSSTPHSTMRSIYSRSSSRSSLVPSSPSLSVQGLSDNDAIVISDGEDIEIRKVLGLRYRQPRPSPSPGGSPSFHNKKSHKRKRANTDQLAVQITITGKLRVERIEFLSDIPTTWIVPRVPTAYLVNASSLELLKKSGERQSLDAFIRAEVCTLILLSGSWY